MGVQRRKLDIPGSRELMGRGVSYCPVCDGVFFKGKDVAVVGNDDDAANDALYLTAIARSIYLIPESTPPRYSRESEARLTAHENVKIVQGYRLAEMLGGNVLEEVRLEGITVKGELRLKVAGVFLSGEKAPILTMLANSGVKIDQSGCIITDDKFQTAIKGVYAIGDMTCEKKYQVSISVGQGATVALNIIREIR
jgi:thioredoxin reductase (NADPH)